MTKTVPFNAILIPGVYRLPQPCGHVVPDGYPGGVDVWRVSTSASLAPRMEVQTYESQMSITTGWRCDSSRKLLVKTPSRYWIRLTHWGSDKMDAIQDQPIL